MRRLDGEDLIMDETADVFALKHLRIFQMDIVVRNASAIKHIAFWQKRHQTHIVLYANNTWRAFNIGKLDSTVCLPRIYYDRIFKILLRLIKRGAQLSTECARNSHLRFL